MAQYYVNDPDKPYSNSCPYNFKGYMTVGESEKLLAIAAQNGWRELDINDYIRKLIREYPDQKLDNN